MMEAKYTPGPWEEIGSLVRSKFGTNEDGVGGGGFLVADCSAIGMPGTANARLISAAPELLEACEKAKEFIDLNVIGGGVWHSKLSAAHLAIEFAIAKAKGEE